jgi:Cu/Ag efflux protein CusF
MSLANAASQTDKEANKENKQEKEKTTELTPAEPGDVFIFHEADGEDFPEFTFGEVSVAIADDVTIQTGEGGVTLAAPPMPALDAMKMGAITGDGTEAQGVITNIENNGAKITVNKQRVINLNDQTTVGEAAGALKKEDLKVGDRIVALGKVETDKTLTARYLLRQPALPIAIKGTISSVDAAGNTIKLKMGKDNAEWTVTVTSATQINRDGKTISLADLKAGDDILVTGKADKAAKKIEASFISNGHPTLVAKPVAPPNMAVGTVKSIDVAGNSFVLSETVGITPTERKISVDSTTKFSGPNGVKGLADLKVGDKVVVNGEKQSDGSITAKHVGTGVHIEVRTGPGPGEKGGQAGGKPAKPVKPGAPPEAPEPPKDKQG